MNDNEKIIKEEFESKGYKTLRKGHPDFVFYKEKDGKIKDIIFVEVKTNSDKLTTEQLKYSKIIKSLNLNYKIIKKQNEINKIDPIKISENNKKELDKLKIHPRQSYDEIIGKIINGFKE